MLGHIYSHPGSRAPCGLWVEHPCKVSISCNELVLSCASKRILVRDILEKIGPVVTEIIFHIFCIAFKLCGHLQVN